MKRFFTVVSLGVALVASSGLASAQERGVPGAPRLSTPADRHWFTAISTQKPERRSSTPLPGMPWPGLPTRRRPGDQRR